MKNPNCYMPSCGLDGKYCPDCANYVPPRSKIMDNNNSLEIAKTSPALNWQSDKAGDYGYPANFRGRVPLKVKLATTVYPDVPFVPSGTVAGKDCEYYVWVNSYGAVSAILPNGEKLGLRPSEFDVIEWHPSEK